MHLLSASRHLFSRSRTPNRKPHSARRVTLGIVVAVLVAAVCAAVLRAVLATPKYDIDPSTVLLTQADVTPYSLEWLDGITGYVGPAQDTFKPLPYQEQMIAGRIRIFDAQSVLSPNGRKEINDWSARYGGPVTNPPTVMGPFVAEHSGIFELDDVSWSFRTIDAAKQEYSCCHYVGRSDSFSLYQTLPLQLGDQGDAWTGIKRPLSGPGITDMPQDESYQELGYVLHWRRGPIVSNLSIWGAHDITFDQALSFARIVDGRIAQAMRQHQVMEVSHALVDSSHSSGASPTAAIRAADRRTCYGLHGG